MTNPWMHCTPLRVRDIYGHWYYISRERYEAGKVLIPICTKSGLLRSYTPAGRDGQNSLHRENIAVVKEAIPLSLAECNRARREKGEKPVKYLSFDGKTSVSAKTISDVCKTGNGVLALTPGEKEICHKTVPGYYLSEDGGRWKAFICSQPIEAEHLTAFWQPEPVETHEVDPWLQLAVSHDRGRPVLCAAGGNIAADGYRLHYRRDLPPTEYPMRASAESVLEKARRQQKTIIHLAPSAAEEVVKLCKLASKWDTSLHLTFNGRLDYSIESVELGTSIGSLSSGYEHRGADASILINPKHLAQAIGKPDKRIWILFSDPQHTIYLTDGETREAVIMASK